MDLDPLLAEVERRRAKLEEMRQDLAVREAKARADLGEAEAKVRAAEEAQAEVEQARRASGEARRARQRRLAELEEQVRRSAKREAVWRSQLLRATLTAEIKEEEGQETLAILQKMAIAGKQSTQLKPDLAAELEGAKTALAMVNPESASQEFQQVRDALAKCQEENQRLREQTATMLASAVASEERTKRTKLEARASANRERARHLRLTNMVKELEQQVYAGRSGRIS